MKFFATTDYDGKSDKYDPHLDIDELEGIYCYELQYPTVFQQHCGYSLKTIGKQNVYAPRNSMWLSLTDGTRCGLKDFTKGYFSILPP